MEITEKKTRSQKTIRPHNHRPRKMDNHDYALNAVRDLLKVGKVIRRIEGSRFSNPHYYTREPGKGWWMVTKELVVMRYISTYLRILRSQSPRIKLFFIDLLSSWGMNRITKEETDVFHFPGSSILAAWQNSFQNKKFFDKLYCNDYDPVKRKTLARRFDRLNQINRIRNNPINYYVPGLETDENLDSNNVVDNIIRDMNREGNNFSNYLLVADNEGLNITFGTLEKVRKWSIFGDIIINYPDTGLNRAYGNNHWKCINAFFGRNMENIPKNQWKGVYQEQLMSIDLEFTELFPVHAGPNHGNFKYTLIFAARKTPRNAPWLNMIKSMAQRFGNWNGDTMKFFWDIATGKIKNEKQLTLI